MFLGQIVGSVFKAIAPQVDKLGKLVGAIDPARLSSSIREVVGTAVNTFPISPSAAVENFQALNFAKATPSEVLFKAHELIQTVEPQLNVLEQTLGTQGVSKFKNLIKEVSQLTNNGASPENIVGLFQQSGLIGGEKGQLLLELGGLLELAPDELQQELNGLILPQSAKEEGLILPESAKSSSTSTSVSVPESISSPKLTEADIKDAFDVIANGAGTEQQRAELIARIKDELGDERYEQATGKYVDDTGVDIRKFSGVTQEAEEAAEVERQNLGEDGNANRRTLSAFYGYDNVELMISKFSQKLGMDLSPHIRAISEEEAAHAVEGDTLIGSGQTTEADPNAINLGANVLENMNKVIRDETVSKEVLADTIQSVQLAMGGDRISSEKIDMVVDRYEQTRGAAQTVQNGTEHVETQAGVNVEAEEQVESLTPEQQELQRLRKENEMLKAGVADSDLTVSEHSSVDDDVHTLSENVVRALTSEINKADTVANFFFGMSMQGSEYIDPYSKEKAIVPDASNKAELESYIRGQLFGPGSEKFGAALKQQLLHMDGKAEKPTADAFGLEGMQAKAFGAIKGSLRVSQYVPNGVINIFGKLKLATPVISGFLSKLPGGRMLNMAFLMFNEYVVNNLTFHQNSVQLMTDLGKKYNTNNKSSNQSSNSQPAAREQNPQHARTNQRVAATAGA